MSSRISAGSTRSSPCGLVGGPIDRFINRNDNFDLFISRAIAAQTSRMVVGSKTMELTTNPVLDIQGNRLGVIIEWVDLTNELKAAEEVAEVVEAAPMATSLAVCRPKQAGHALQDRDRREPGSAKLVEAERASSPLRCAACR